MITYEDIVGNEGIKTYIAAADATLAQRGYTEHSFAHTAISAKRARWILKQLGRPERTCELAAIAGHLHDIGNVVNRVDHAQSGATLAFGLLHGMGMPPDEIVTVVTAIGHHDESTALAVNDVTAALIIADKCDVRRSRVRNTDRASFDIHDRVNYAVESGELALDPAQGTITLQLRIDTQISAVMDYFEIFLSRMLLCRKAAEKLGLNFKLVINGTALL